jgi:hypothetical protein
MTQPHEIQEIDSAIAQSRALIAAHKRRIHHLGQARVHYEAYLASYRLAHGLPEVPPPGLEEEPEVQVEAVERADEAAVEGPAADEVTSTDETPSRVQSTDEAMESATPTLSTPTGSTPTPVTPPRRLTRAETRARGYQAWVAQQRTPNRIPLIHGASGPDPQAIAMRLALSD